VPNSYKLPVRDDETELVGLKKLTREDWRPFWIPLYRFRQEFLPVLASTG